MAGKPGRREKNQEPVGVILETDEGTHTEVLMEEVLRRGQILDVVGKIELIGLLMDCMCAVRERRQAGQQGLQH